MSTYTSEPGTRLAGRYRLVDQVNEGAGWTYWKATDETLARSVTVLTFATGFPRVAEAITAARAASRLNDPRFPQVFDVEDADELPYVVMEWVVGESLLDMLAEGPLDPPRAAALVLEAAQAITAAQAAGLSHLRLNPACLHWTPGGGVKIAGLGIDAALAGPALTGAGLTDPEPPGPGVGDPELDDPELDDRDVGDPELTRTDLPRADLTRADPTAGQGAEDPALTDTRDLARLLYAALTGYWPGQQSTGGSGPGLLPPAPETDGTLCTPRQVSAGVPAALDAVTCQALFQRPSRHGPALSTPAMFADALASVAPPVSMAFLPASGQTTSIDYGRDAATNPYPKANADTRSRSRSGSGRSQPPRRRRSQPPRGGRSRPPRRRAAVTWTAISVVIVVVLAAIGVALWSATRGPHTTASPTPGGTQSTSPAAAADVVLKPASASVFAQGSTDDPSGAQYAIDGSTSTFWHTDYYVGNPVFGGLDTGMGLILDMGKEVRLNQVMVQFGTICCTHAEIAIGNSDTPGALNTFTELQSSSKASGATTFDISKNTTGRYVLIWITSLPAEAGASNHYQALVYNIVVRGPAAAQSG
jgi:serine/threonine protein kinase